MDMPSVQLAYKMQVKAAKGALFAAEPLGLELPWLGVRRTRGPSLSGVVISMRCLVMREPGYGLTACLAPDRCLGTRDESSTVWGPAVR